MLGVCLYCILYSAMHSAFAIGTNDSQAYDMQLVKVTQAPDPVVVALTEDISYTLLFQQDVPRDDNDTADVTQCIGLAIDLKTIITLQACEVAKSIEEVEVIESPLGTPLATLTSYNITQIAESPPKMSLGTRTHTVNPPMTLGANFLPPALIDTKERYEEFKNQDRFGIVLAKKGPKVGLVRWYEQMTSENKGKGSVCEENYSSLQQKNPEWPETLPEGIFCIRGGHQHEDKYTMVVGGENVAIEADLPCGASVGSPIIIPNEGVLGVVTAAYCESDPKVTYAQSLAYAHINTTEDDQRNQKIQEPTNSTLVVSEFGSPLDFQPMPPYYLASPFIKVIEPTTSSANHIWGFMLPWNVGVLSYYNKIPVF